MASRYKIIPIGILCCCLLIAAGCSPLSTLFGTDDSVDPTKYLTEFKDKPWYGTLNSDEKQCYGAIYTTLTDQFSNESSVALTMTDNSKSTTLGIAVTLPNPLKDKAQAQAIFNAVVYDNPQFFHINNRFGLEGYENKGATKFTTILFTYTMDADTRQSAKKQLDNAVSALVAGAPDTSDDYLIERYLHDQLAAICSYDHEAAVSNSDIKPAAYSAYGALVNGKAVCEGYTRAIQLLLARCNIISTPILGESIETGEQHMWNIVTINGHSYHLDVTWNDSDNGLRYNYFNTTTEQIQLSHRIHKDTPFDVSCTATTDNYYRREGLYVQTYSRQNIAAIIANRIKAGDTHIELQFEADKYDNALLFLKNFSAAKERINPLLFESGLSLWSYRLYSDANEHILRIQKK